MHQEERKFTTYRGVEMIEGWPERIRAAQVDTHVNVEGRRLARIPYGAETRPWGASRPCRDCAVFRGELHVPGCDAEECPACGGQAIGCGCSDPPEDFEE